LITYYTISKVFISCLGSHPSASCSATLAAGRQTSTAISSRDIRVVPEVLYLVSRKHIDPYFMHVFGHVQSWSSDRVYRHELRRHGIEGAMFWQMDIAFYQGLSSSCPSGLAKICFVPLCWSFNTCAEGAFVLCVKLYCLKF